MSTATPPVLKTAPCQADMVGQPLDATCANCGHSAFTHMIEADGCIICEVRSTRDDIAEMLAEMRGIMEWFSQRVKPSAPKVSGGKKLRRKRSR